VGWLLWSANIDRILKAFFVMVRMKDLTGEIYKGVAMIYEITCVKVWLRLKM